MCRTGTGVALVSCARFTAAPACLPHPACADLLVHTAFEAHPNAAPATVHDKVNVGARVRYYLRFDDAVVRCAGLLLLGWAWACSLPAACNCR